MDEEYRYFEVIWVNEFDLQCQFLHITIIPMATVSNVQDGC